MGRRRAARRGACSASGPGRGPNDCWVGPGRRAIHVIVYRDARLAEVQLRTFAQDRWAQVVESIDSRFQYDLKARARPADWLEWLHVLSDEFRKDDLGEPFEIPKTPLDRFDLDLDPE